MQFIKEVCKMQWKNKGHEFDELAKIICENKNENGYYIWGAGTFGISFAESFRDKLNLLGFVDSKKEKQGKEICGMPVYAPEYLSEHRGYILVSAGWTKDIFTKLSEMGYVKNKDCFHIDEFTSIYMFYKEGKVYLSDIGCCITQYCTLRCKNCASLIPKIKHPRHIPIENIKEDLEAFFRWTDSVNILALEGGDAMLHPGFDEILEMVGKMYYPEKAMHLEVYSNAVLIPSHDTLEIMKKYDVFYRFTDYYPYTQGRQHIEEITKLLEQYHIRYDHVKFQQWLNYGYPQTSNGIQDEDNLRNYFNMCDRRSCHGLYQKKVMFCSMGQNAEWAGYCDRDESDSFDIAVYDENKRAEYLEFMLGYTEKGYLEYCKKCNGSFNVNNKFIPAGEQMT